MSNIRFIKVLLYIALLIMLVASCSEGNGWKEKAFSELSDNEIEATLNISKRVFDEILGNDLPKYYQTESISIPKESGFFQKKIENMRELSEPIIALSVAYPTGRINESVISQLKKRAESEDIDWEGFKVLIIESIIEVDTRGLGENHDKITIYPLKVKVLELKQVSLPPEEALRPRPLQGLRITFDYSGDYGAYGIADKAQAFAEDGTLLAEAVVLKLGSKAEPKGPGRDVIVEEKHYARGGSKKVIYKGEIIFNTYYSQQVISEKALAGRKQYNIFTNWSFDN